MLVKIKKIEGDQLTVSKDKVIKTYTMEEFVVPHAELGLADIDFNEENKKIRFIKMQDTEQPKDRSQPKGSFSEDLIKFEDLLNAAHELGIQSINTEMISIDFEKKSAVFKAKVSMALEKPIKLLETETICNQVFEAYGDATQENCGDLVKKHWIRMAETRAIARALRWATNNAKTAEEETEKATKD